MIEDSQISKTNNNGKHLSCAEAKSVSAALTAGFDRLNWQVENDSIGGIPFDSEIMFQSRT